MRKSYSSGIVGENELHAHGLSLLGEVVQDPLSIPLLEVVLPLVDVFLAVSEHGVDQSELDRVSHETSEN